MEYSVRPSSSELEKVRSQIEKCVSSYEYELDIEDLEIFLCWQRHEGDFSVLDSSEDELIIAVDPDTEEYNFEAVLRGLFEIEFFGKMSYDKIEFKWQELAKFAYVALKMKEIKGEELKLSEEIVARWPSIQEQLDKSVSTYEEFFYLNTGLIGEALATKLEEEYNSEDIPSLKKSEIVTIGEKFFE